MTCVYVNPNTSKVSLPVDDNGEIEVADVPGLIEALTELIEQ